MLLMTNRMTRLWMRVSVHSWRTSFLPLKIKSGCFGHRNFITSMSCAALTRAENKSLDLGDFLFSVCSCVKRRWLLLRTVAVMEPVLDGQGRTIFWLICLCMSTVGISSRTAELR